MKLTIKNLLIIVVLFFTACKKNDVLTSEENLNFKVKQWVKKEVSEENFTKLDWDRLTFYSKDGTEQFAKIPLLGSIGSGSKAIYVNISEPIFKGNYFEFNKQNNQLSIVTTSLNNKRICNALVDNNDINNISYKVYEDGKLIEEKDNNHLPTIFPARPSIPATYYYNFNVYLICQLLGIGQPNYVGNPANPLEVEFLPEDVNPTGSGSTSEIIEIELDNSESQPGIDLEKYLKCFENIPSAGATYQIKLYVDVPINSIPGAPLNLFDGMSPGHTFLRLSKTNGTQTADQVIGFYPQNGIKSMAMVPVTSKIVDDGNNRLSNQPHEFNASYTMLNISAAQFDAVIAKLRLNATTAYQLNGFNCASFALEAFNAARTTPISSYPMTVFLGSGSSPIILPQSPQGVYQYLQALKNNDPAEAVNIETMVDMLTLPSKGECN